jgi:hypothetical protein
MPTRPADASDFTRGNRINATITPDPSKQSRVYQWADRSLIGATVRAGAVSFPTNSVLRNPIAKSPRFNGRVYLI